MISLKDLPNEMDKPLKPNFFMIFISGLIVAIIVAALNKIYFFDDVFVIVNYFIAFLVFIFVLYLFFLNRVYEGEVKYVDEWNKELDYQKKKAISIGRRSVLVVDYSYKTSLANNNIYKSIKLGGKSVSSILAPNGKDVYCLAGMEPFSKNLDIIEYEERLIDSFQKTVASLNFNVISKVKQKISLRVKHDGFLEDDRVSELFFDFIDSEFFGDVFFDCTDSALWLNEYVDNESFVLMSLEIDIFNRSYVNYSGESVSIVILSSEKLVKDFDLPCLGKVHRVLEVEEGFFWDDLIKYSNIFDSNIFLVSNGLRGIDNTFFIERLSDRLVGDMEVSSIMGEMKNSIANISIILSCEILEDVKTPCLILTDENICFSVTSA